MERVPSALAEMKAQEYLVASGPKEIKSRNIKTKAWVAEDPENRWAGLYPEDEAHWVERGITTLDALERSELEEYIYDAHKTAFGCKGRHYDFNSMTLQELKAVSYTHLTLPTILRV